MTLNWKRIWLGALAGGVVWGLWSVVTNFVVLVRQYQAAQGAGTMLAQPRYFFFPPAWPLTLFVLSFILAWIYAGVRATFGKGPKTAVFVGFVLGFAFGFPLNFSLAAWAPFPRIIPLWWMLEMWVGAVLATLVAGWIYRD